MSDRRLVKIVSEDSWPQIGYVDLENVKHTRDGDREILEYTVEIDTALSRKEQSKWAPPTAS